MIGSIHARWDATPSPTAPLSVRAAAWALLAVAAVTTALNSIVIQCYSNASIDARLWPFIGMRAGGEDIF